jgi:ADP-heptose:LPS heptosyltransferase
MGDKLIANRDRVLVVTSSSTGNNVFATPAIHLLRRALPDSLIDVLALSELSAEVFHGNPYINYIHVTARHNRFEQIAKAYDHVIVLHPNSLRKLKIRADSVLAVTSLEGDKPHADQLLAFVSKLVGSPVMDADRKYILGSADHEPVIQASQYQTHQIVNIHLGCARTALHGWKFWYSKRADEDKLWSVDAYIKLGKLLTQAHPKIRIALTGTSNEAFLAKQFLRILPGTINLIGKTTVRQLHTHLAQCALFISQDCGVLHVASATNVPILALFGPTSPMRSGPYPAKPCQLVLKKSSMQDIEPEEVADIAMGLLGVQTDHIESSYSMEIALSGAQGLPQQESPAVQ